MVLDIFAISGNMTSTDAESFVQSHCAGLTAIPPRCDLTAGSISLSVTISGILLAYYNAHKTTLQQQVLKDIAVTYGLGNDQLTITGEVTVNGAGGGVTITLTVTYTPGSSSEGTQLNSYVNANTECAAANTNNQTPYSAQSDMTDGVTMSATSTYTPSSNSGSQIIPSLMFLIAIVALLF